jgi:L-fucose mutarotase/ribose pyranase (RbsD/FucU family)
LRSCTDIIFLSSDSDGFKNADVNRGLPPPIWGTYKEIVNKAEGRDVPITSLERFAFYERTKKAYAVVSTG